VSDRNKHSGREADGRVRRADVDDMMEDPNGADLIRDDVRLGGAVADSGPHAGEHARHIEEVIEGNREDVGRATGRLVTGRGKRGRKR
jgi:hypothetical protein